MEKNLKNYRKQLRDTGVFYTDEKLAKMLMGYIDNNPKTVYDPTCGQGNLLKVFPDDVKKFGQELDEKELEKAKNEVVNFVGYAGDTLTDDGFKGMKFDAIVGNMPFSIKWNPNPNDERFNICPKLAPQSKADYAFILHMLSHIDENGIIATVCFPGILYRGNAEGVIRQWLIDNNYIDRVISVPPGYFTDTNINTAILIIRKNKKDRRITFEDLEKGIVKTVEYDDVVNKGYTLSVNQYAIEEIKKEEIDINKLNKECRISSLKNFIGKVEFDIMVAGFENDIDMINKLENRLEILKQWLEEDL